MPCTDDEAAAIFATIEAGTGGWNDIERATWRKKITQQPGMTAASGAEAAVILIDSWPNADSHPDYPFFVTACQAATRQLAAAPARNPTHARPAAVKLDPARYLVLAAAATLMGDTAWWDAQGWPAHDHTKGGTAEIEVQEGGTLRRRPARTAGCPRCGEHAIDERWPIAVTEAEGRWEAGLLHRPSDLAGEVRIGLPARDLEPVKLTTDDIERERARLRAAYPAASLAPEGDDQDEVRNPLRGRPAR